jgi:hypothetical protein
MANREANARQFDRITRHGAGRLPPARHRSLARRGSAGPEYRATGQATFNEEETMPLVRRTPRETGLPALAIAAALACLALLAAAVPAAATDLGLRLGYYAGKDADEPVPVIGAYGRIDVPGPVNLELSADYRTESLREGALEAVVIPVRVSAVLNPLPIAGPYLVAGAGADYTSVSFHQALAGTGDESALALELHAGGGFELSLGLVSIAADLRYCAVEGVANDAVKAALGHAYDPSGWYASLSAAVSF